MPKVKIKIGFRYNIESVIDADPNWKELYDEHVKQAKKEILKELDFMFSDNNSGVISDWSAEVEEVEE